MAHFAEVNEDNIVVRVLVTDNDHSDGQEGYAWLTENFGGRWIKTSYNTYGGVHQLGGVPLRKNYAGIGYAYNESLDAFIPPKPDGDFWILNEDTGLWVNPISEDDTV